MPSTTFPSTIPLELALITASSVANTLAPLESLLVAFSSGEYHSILTGSLASSILSFSSDITSDQLLSSYSDLLADNIKATTYHPAEVLLLGISALNAYLQATATGPPLPFFESALLPETLRCDKRFVKRLKQALIRNFSVDGESAYHLLSHPILLTIARTTLNHPLLSFLPTAPWWRFRVNFVHQRMLREAASNLHNDIYKDLQQAEALLQDSSFHTDQDKSKWLKATYLIERSTVHSFYGYDTKVRNDLEEAARATGLQYAITGRLGKRTKYQVEDLSQLVVLAKSKEDYSTETEASGDAKVTESNENGDDSTAASTATKPKTLDLNDDTLLETIKFIPVTDAIMEESDLPQELLSLSLDDPPVLHPLDSVILLHLAESIKNTNPADGITREQMTPYAERVLKHSTNWSIHTIGLLVRSRLEAFKSRTVERSVLQLQVVVDQVVAATASEENEGGVSTFLPKPKEEESAAAEERLKYAYILSLPTRWDVESELAARWVSMGGLRTALGIYERLGLWAEVALCWAAVDKEEKGVEIVKKLLFEGEMPKADDSDISNLDDDEEEIMMTDEEEKEPVERDPPPPEAPRLWCILGDMEKNPEHYRKAWAVSGERYARAQRSLGVYYLRKKEWGEAIKAYALSLKINPLNHGSWFQYGCALLEVAQWDAAVEAFSRVVSIDDNDAEGWSNLATALLRRGKSTKDTGGVISLDDDEEATDLEGNRASNAKAAVNDGKMQALTALKRAVRLKNDSWRMWENILVISASTTPPQWNDVQVAIRRIVELRGSKVGEQCIDVELLDMLVREVINVSDSYDPAKPGLERMTVELVDTKIVPLITADEKLWDIVRRLAVWRKKYSTALECQEKAFRVVSGRYDIRTDKKSWDELAEATEDMVDAYRSFGEMEKSEGLGAGSGQLVMKDWRFKARTVVRTVMGKGRKGGWDEDEMSWSRLEELQEGLKS